jgi:hypothetical protein
MDAPGPCGDLPRQSLAALGVPQPSPHFLSNLDTSGLPAALGDFRVPWHKY